MWNNIHVLFSLKQYTKYNNIIFEEKKWFIYIHNKQEKDVHQN